MSGHFGFEVVSGYFEYDDPSVVKSSLDAIEPRFGLRAGMSWKKLLRELQELRTKAVNGTEYRLIYAIRHGEGYHNVAEGKYGTKAWDDKWALLTTDGEIIWGPDPELTPLGLSQAKDINKAWLAQIQHKKEDPEEEPPLPTRLFSSPLTRSAQTLLSAYENLGIVTSPYVLENLRENYADKHTCDCRSSRSQISARFPTFEFEDSFEEEDMLFGRVFESREQITERVALGLANIVRQTPEDEVISIVSHSGTMQALFRAVGIDDFKPKTGAIVSFILKATPTNNP